MLPSGFNPGGQTPARMFYGRNANGNANGNANALPPNQGQPQPAPRDLTGRTIANMSHLPNLLRSPNLATQILGNAVQALHARIGRGEISKAQQLDQGSHILALAAMLADGKEIDHEVLQKLGEDENMRGLGLHELTQEHNKLDGNEHLMIADILMAQYRDWNEIAPEHMQVHDHGAEAEAHSELLEYRFHVAGHILRAGVPLNQVLETFPDLQNETNVAALQQVAAEVAAAAAARGTATGPTHAQIHGVMSAAIRGPTPREAVEEALQRLGIQDPSEVDFFRQKAATEEARRSQAT